MFQNILVPFDNSEPAKRALTAALDMADHGEGVQVVVLSAVDFPQMESAALTSGLGVVETIQPMDVNQMRSTQDAFKQDHLKSLIQQVDEHLGVQASRVECRVGMGRPQDAVIDAVEEGPFDLVIMGSRGLGAVRGMLGSVSSAVLHDVTIPVLVVK